jgi:transposase
MEIRALAELYRSGLSIDVLAIRYRVHRTAVIRHLEAQEVPRRRVVRKLRDDQVTKATEPYASGLSLARIAASFDVHEATLTREFRAANVPIRPRRGWTK